MLSSVGRALTDRWCALEFGLFRLRATDRSFKFDQRHLLIRKFQVYFCLFFFQYTICLRLLPPQLKTFFAIEIIGSMPIDLALEAKCRL